VAALDQLLNVSLDRPRSYAEFLGDSLDRRVAYAGLRVPVFAKQRQDMQRRHIAEGPIADGGGWQHRPGTTARLHQRFDAPAVFIGAIETARLQRRWERFARLHSLALRPGHSTAY
jgi:hypothetical protein